MNYQVWSEEYFLQANKVKNHFQQLKKELKGKRASEKKDINRRIALIYPMYLELKHTGNYLKYYSRRNINE